MSNKINVFAILKGNFNTLYNADTNKRSIMDIITFYGLPLSVAYLAYSSNYEISKNVISQLVNASALLSGLLLNLLILIFGLKDKLKQPQLGNSEYNQIILKRKIMEELYFNVCAASLTSLFLLCFSIFNTIVSNVFIFELNVNTVFINPVIVFLSLHLLVSFLMITKRTYKLLLNI
jgi:hypothetical protein